MTTPLRKCHICGLEAWTEENLENFTKDKKSPHGRTTICKKCLNIRTLKWSHQNPLKGRHIGMISRCYNPNKTEYRLYGGRGITVCDEWRNDINAFIDWANENGFKPELTIDRIDNDGPYSPENCRWVTQEQQCRNKRTNTTNWEKGTRICQKCKIEKPFSEFHKSSEIGWSGYKYTCKICYSAYQREYTKRKRREKLLLL